MLYETEIRNMIVDIAELTKDVNELGLQDRLQNAGLDSLAFVSLIIEIEKAFGIEFPDEKFSIKEAGTIQQLCEILASVKTQNVESKESAYEAETMGEEI